MSGSLRKSASSVPPPPRDPAEIRELNSRVWDLTLNLIHPAALYVLFQLVLLDHLGRSPALAPFAPLHPVSLLVYGFQFLGAWAVFYTTLLRDMGYRCPWGTILLIAALAAMVGQYFVFREPARADAVAVWCYLGSQLLLAAIGWPATMIRWRRRKSEHEAAQESAS